jgi:hypothetical protein
MIQRWTTVQGQPATDADPAGYSIGLAPHGSRVYVWPTRDAVSAGFPPVVTWSRDGQAVQVLGVTQLPQYWWVLEEYGKADWAPDCSILRPPVIGNADPRFAFDGQSGEAYKAFNLQPHSPCPNR